MAAIFTNRIVDAFYTNPELDTIEVVYAQVVPGEDMTGIDVERLGAFDVKTRPVSHWVTVDPDDWQYQELTKEISIERIDNRTIEINEGNRTRFVESFQRYAAEQGWSQNPTMPAEIVTSSLDDLIFNFDESHQESKEELFKEINADKPNKKRRAKCIRELERRGVNISWTSIPKDSIA